MGEIPVKLQRGVNHYTRISSATWLVEEPPIKTYRVCDQKKILSGRGREQARKVPSWVIQTKRYCWFRRVKIG